MKVVLKATANFEITVAPAVIDCIVEIGRSHYDAVCKAAAHPGGFLYGWRNGGYAALASGEQFVIRATTRELDTTLKICEMAPYHDIDSPTKAKLGEFIVRAHQAISRSNDIIPTWSAEV